jgi:hypothetical protein
MATSKQFQDYFFQAFNYKDSFVLFQTPEIGVNSSAKKHYQNAELAISKMGINETKQVINNLYCIKQRFIQIINSSLVTNGDINLINQHKADLERLKNLLRMVNWNTPKQSELLEQRKVKQSHNALQTYILGKMKVAGILDRLSNK